MSPFYLDFYLPFRCFNPYVPWRKWFWYRWKWKPTCRSQFTTCRGFRILGITIEWWNDKP